MIWAKEDLIEGYRFDEHVEAGRSGYFLTNLYTDIDSPGILGGLHAKPYRHFPRALSKRFPFVIFSPPR